MLDHVYKKTDRGTREHAVVVWIVEPAGLTALTDTSVLFFIYSRDESATLHIHVCEKAILIVQPSHNIFLFFVFLVQYFGL